MINVRNAEENEGYLPESLSSFPPYDVMNQKNGDLEWKNGLRIEDLLVRGLVENQLLQQWLCDHATTTFIKYFQRSISENI